LAKNNEPYFKAYIKPRHPRPDYLDENVLTKVVKIYGETKAMSEQILNSPSRSRPAGVPALIRSLLMTLSFFRRPVPDTNLSTYCLACENYTRLAPGSVGDW